MLWCSVRHFGKTTMLIGVREVLQRYTEICPHVVLRYC